jgi:hypothetical protein
MKGRIAIAVAAIVLAMGAPAAAGPSGNDVLPYCEVRLGDNLGGVATEALGHGQCWGVVSTLISVADLMIDGPRFCPPKGGTVKQGVSIVVKALRERPETLHKQFVELAHFALIKAWPCGAAQ